MGRWLPIYIVAWLLAFLISLLTELATQATPPRDEQQRVACSEKVAMASGKSCASESTGNR
jgi:hypothetical protein